MPHITKRTLGPLVFAGILIRFGYIAAQQSPSQQSGEHRASTTVYSGDATAAE